MRLMDLVILGDIIDDGMTADEDPSKIINKYPVGLGDMYEVQKETNALKIRNRILICHEDNAYGLA
jgi:hypothetical protein